MIIAWIAAGLILTFGFVVFFGAPYVPSHKKQVERALTELYHVHSTDVLVDVGSGDGIVLRIAAGKGARAIGYELNPILVFISRLLARPFGSKIQVQLANFWHTSLPEATTVIYVFMVERDAKKMASKIQAEANRLNHPLSLISYGAALPAHEPVQKVGAHYLYSFTPLQSELT